MTVNADVPPFSSVRRQRWHASTPADSSSVLDHFPSPASPLNSSFPARSQNFKQNQSRRKTEIRLTRRGGKVAGDAAGVRWSGGAPSPAPSGGERRDVRTLCRRASTLEDSSSVVDHFPSPASPFFSSFPVLGDLTGEGKWSGTLLESSGVEAHRHRRRRVENRGTSAL
ncbi:hypothetical protein ACLB2K_001301 [Fragaria x ananassa]